MDFILNQQAKFEADIQEMKEADERAAKRMDRLERVLKLAVRAALRDRKEFRLRYETLVDAQMRTEAALSRTDAALSRMEAGLSQLAARQAHSDNRLDTLINIIIKERNVNKEAL